MTGGVGKRSICTYISILREIASVTWAFGGEITSAPGSIHVGENNSGICHFIVDLAVAVIRALVITEMHR